MNGKRKRWIWGAAAAAALILVALGSQSLGKPGGISLNRSVSAAETSGQTVNQGRPDPNFNLKDTKGNAVSLADFKGEKVYVKFWASWCPICLAGLDEINQLSGQQHDYKVLTIVSPGYNGEQSEADFVSWFSKRGYDNMEVLLDEGGSLAKQFGVRGYPTSFYIGSDGVLAKSVPGHNPNDLIAQTIDSIH